MDSRKALSNYISDKGIKLTFVSKQTGLSVDQISKVLRKERNLLADELIKICKALQIPLNYFDDDDQAAAKDAG